MTEKTQTLTDIIQADHKKLGHLFRCLKETQEPNEKADIVQAIALELDRHTRFEQELFYPAAKEALPNSDLFDDALKASERIKIALDKLQRLLPDKDREYDHAAARLRDLFQAHVKTEEGSILPKIKGSELDVVLGQRYSSSHDEHPP